MAQHVEPLKRTMLDLNEDGAVRILHVDDDLGLLKVTKQSLEMEGQFQVKSTLSVDEAYQTIEGHFFDAIVSDYEMPLKDGLSFLKELRQNVKTIPFIFFTGRGREEVAIRALNLGADHYIHKTGNPETVYGELAHAVREAVERKRAIEKLRESEARYRVLFDNMAVGVVLVDKDGCVVAANEPERRFLGYAKEELVGMNFQRYVHPSDFNIGAALLKELVEGKRASYTIERRYVRKDGLIVWGRSSGSSIRDDDGHFKYLVAVLKASQSASKKRTALDKGRTYKGLEMLQESDSSLRSESSVFRMK